MANQEIEIKVKVTDNEPLEDFLKKEGEFKFDKHQNDQYYTPAHRNFTETDPIKEWFRLRTEDDKTSLNYKNWHYTEDGNAYHCDEFETNVSDPDNTINILKALDFKKVIVVDKKRKVYVYKDYEIALDIVKDLGDFIEVEYIGKEDIQDPKQKTKEMVEFLQKTGCEIIERDFKGYPYLLLEKV